jgi:hypothetical protein
VLHFGETTNINCNGFRFSEVLKKENLIDKKNTEKPDLNNLRSSKMNKSLTIFIGFIHDFAAGFWVATVFAVLALTSVVLALLTGMGRTITYIENYYGKRMQGK